MARLPRIRGTQIGLRNPAAVDAIKADMRAGTFRFLEARAQIGGILDRTGSYHIEEGHHRMVAALELYRETGNDQYVRELLLRGRWSLATAPRVSRPMPARTWWRRFRNRIGY